MYGVHDKRWLQSAEPVDANTAGSSDVKLLLMDMDEHQRSRIEHVASPHCLSDTENWTIWCSSRMT